MHSLKLTAKALENMPGPKKKRFGIPTIHFQVRTLNSRSVPFLWGGDQRMEMCCNLEGFGTLNAVLELRLMTPFQGKYYQYSLGGGFKYFFF